MDEKTLKRFWSKVNKDGPTPAHCPELGPCWVWIAARTADGYGQFGLRGQMRGAHRAAWEIGHGETPLCVLHRCDNPSCVRDSHLFLGTLADNNRDRNAKGRESRGRRHGDTSRGDKSGMAKLTEAAVLEIRAMSAVKRTHASIALQFGVSRRAIGLVLSRKTWGHV